MTNGVWKRRKKEYYTDLLEIIIEHNYRSKTPLSKKKLWQEINTIVKETEDEELNQNNITMDIFIQSPRNTQYTKRKKRRWK